MGYGRHLRPAEEFHKMESRLKKIELIFYHIFYFVCFGYFIKHQPQTVLTVYHSLKLYLGDKLGKKR